MARITWRKPPEAERSVDDKSLRVFKVSYSGKKGSDHIRPRLEIVGDWLERAGFATGDVVVVSISKGRIVLRTVDDGIMRDLLAE
jgi:hypothetical protein